MNGTNGWKIATVVLAALLLMVLCCLAGVMIGGVFFSAFRTERHSHSWPVEPPYYGMPEMPLWPEEMEQPWLGVYFDVVAEGAEIIEIVPNSPADDSELEVGDIITAVDDEPVTEEQTLKDLVVQCEPGDRVRLDVLRGDRDLRITVRLGSRTLQMPMSPDEDLYLLPPSFDG